MCSARWRAVPWHHLSCTADRWPHLQAENERVTQQLVEVTAKLGSMQMQLTVAQHRSREASLRSAGNMETAPGDEAAAGVSASLALGEGAGLQLIVGFALGRADLKVWRAAFRAEVLISATCRTSIWLQCHQRVTRNQHSHSALPPNSHVVGRRCCHHQVAGKAQASSRHMATRQHTALCSGLSLRCPSCAAQWERWAALQPALSSLCADFKTCPFFSISITSPVLAWHAGVQKQCLLINQGSAFLDAALRSRFFVSSILAQEPFMKPLCHHCY